MTTGYSIHFIGSVLSCVYKIFGHSKAPVGGFVSPIRKHQFRSILSFIYLCYVRVSRCSQVSIPFGATGSLRHGCLVTKALATCSLCDVDGYAVYVKIFSASLLRMLDFIKEL